MEDQEKYRDNIENRAANFIPISLKEINKLHKENLISLILHREIIFNNLREKCSKLNMITEIKKSDEKLKDNIKLNEENYKYKLKTQYLKTELKEKIEEWEKKISENEGYRTVILRLEGYISMLKKGIHDLVREKEVLNRKLKDKGEKE